MSSPVEAVSAVPFQEAVPSLAAVADLLPHWGEVAPFSDNKQFLGKLKSKPRLFFYYIRL